jgi:hypothetical protein
MRLMPCCYNKRFRFSLRHTSGHLCCALTDVPPQPNSPLDVFLQILFITRSFGQTFERALHWGSFAFCQEAAVVPCTTSGTRRQATCERLYCEYQDHGTRRLQPRKALDVDGPLHPPCHWMSKATILVVVFHTRLDHEKAACHLSNYIHHVTTRCQTRVKLNRVFFPR